MQRTACGGTVRWHFRAAILLCGLAADFIVNSTLLLRPVHVYEALIDGVHDYFRNRNILLFYHSFDGDEGMREMEQLVILQRHLAGSVNVPTSIMEFRGFANRVGKESESIERPLYVLLNDAREIREQLASLSKVTRMGHPTWLLFLGDDTKLEDFLSDVNAPYDCTMLLVQRNTSNDQTEIITEAYRTGKQAELRASKFGTWNAKDGFEGHPMALYRRRNDLYGQSIRVVSVQNPPESTIILDKSNGTAGIGGFQGELLQLLQHQMNSTYTYMPWKSWGVRLANGTYTGQLDDLLNERVDVAASGMVMSLERLQVARFTSVVTSSKCRVYIRRPDSLAVKWKAYLDPFATSTWNSIAVTMLVAGLAIAGIQALAKKTNDFPNTEELSESSKFSEVMFFVFAAFCNQGMPSSPFDSIRLAQLNVYLASVIVLAAYSAALISFLTIKTVTMPFTSIEGMLADGTYQFFVTAETFDYSFFQNTRDPVMSVVFQKMLLGRTDLPRNELESLKRVCKSEKYAYMTRVLVMAQLQTKLDCVLEPLDDDVTQNVRALLLPIRSPYRGIFNRNIGLLRESGVLRRMIEKTVSIVSGPKSEWSPLGMEAVIPLLSLLLVAYLVTGLVLLVELAVYRQQGTRRILRRHLNFSQ